VPAEAKLGKVIDVKKSEANSMVYRDMLFLLESMNTASFVAIAQI
jgi:hypothetical protein